MTEDTPFQARRFSKPVTFLSAEKDLAWFRMCRIRFVAPAQTFQCRPAEARDPPESDGPVGDGDLNIPRICEAERREVAQKLVFVRGLADGIEHGIVDPSAADALASPRRRRRVIRFILARTASRIKQSLGFSENLQGQRVNDVVAYLQVPRPRCAWCTS